MNTGFPSLKNPYYVVRYNSDSEVPAGIQEGTLISFVPEFANHVLNDTNLYKKGYDASNENDEELSDEVEFSDDEKEVEYKRMQKMSKRGTKVNNVEKRKKGKKNEFRSQGGQQESDQPSPAKQPTTRGGKVPFNQGQHSFQSAAASMNQGNSSNSSAPAPNNFSGPGSVSVFPQQAPPFAPPSSGIRANGIQSQPQAPLGFPTGMPNNMPWMQHQPYQMPLLNAMQFQQQFNTGQMLPPNFVLPGGQPSFGAGTTFLPWNPMLIAQNSFNQLQAVMTMQGQHALPSMNIGEQGGPSSGFQIKQNGNFQPPSVIPGNNEASQNFNQGGNFGRGKKPNRRGGGRFGGGRGRQ